MKRAWLMLSISATALMPVPTTAADPDTETELRELRARVATLEALVAQLVEGQAETAAVAAAASATAPETEAGAPEAAARPELSSSATPAVEGEDGWSFKPFGRIQYDFGYVSEPGNLNDPRLGFGNELRRGRLGVGGDIPGGFGYKLELDFADNDVEVTDAIITYDAGDFHFTVGQHNGFQSLEELTSSRFISFMERAAFTDAFGFERRVGASVGYAAGDIRVNAGAFTDNIGDLTDDGNNSRGVDGRIVFTPELGDTQLHFGASAHYRDLQDIPGGRYRQRPFIHTTDTRFIDTGNLPVTDETSFGLEAAVIAGRFHVVAEGHWLNSNLAGMADPTFFGGYVEAGVFLTDDRRGYGGGRFNRTRPNNPVDEGGSGAWQFNIRYDRLDLNGGGTLGGEQNLYAASLIWTPIDHARLVLNYGRLEYQDARPLALTPFAFETDYGADSFGLRVEADF